MPPTRRGLPWGLLSGHGDVFDGTAMTAAASRPEEAERIGVHAGRDGWLFLIGGSNLILSQYGRPGYRSKDLWRWRRILAERRRRCAALGIAYGHVVVPEKLTVFDRSLHGLSIDPDRSPALRLMRRLLLSRARRTWIDLVRPFRAAFAATPLYHRTDTHWTFEGCQLAYEVICRHFGVVPRNDFSDRRSTASINFAGDLGSKYDLVRDEIIRSADFETASRRIYANDLLTSLEVLGRGIEAHSGAHVVYRNDASVDSRTLVLFGDSYAQHTPGPFTGTLTAMFADTFRNVHMIWSPKIDWDYVETIRPDFVLTEIAERFMVVVPE